MLHSVLSSELIESIHELAAPKAALYRERCGCFGPYTAYVVDGSQIYERSLDNEKFGGFGIAAQFPNLIPDNEIWVDKDIDSNERDFLIKGALARLDSLNRGESADKAYYVGIAYEKYLRKAAAAQYPDIKEDDAVAKQQDDTDWLNPTTHPAPYIAGTSAGVLGYLAIRKLLRQAGVDIDAQKEEERQRVPRRLPIWEPMSQRHWYQKQAGVIDQLKDAKRYSDARDWTAKQSIILALIEHKPHDWRIDQDEGGPIVGITHRTGFRFHMPRQALPPTIKPLAVQEVTPPQTIV